MNNRVQQDHRFIKKITKSMKGFKTFHSARSTLAGIELHHMLRKGQYRDKTICATVWGQFYELAA
jgi:putative transposase